MFIYSRYFSSQSVDAVVTARKGDLMGKGASPRDFDRVSKLRSDEWPEIVGRTELQPGSPETRHHFISAGNFVDAYTHLRLNIYPDGEDRKYSNINISNSYLYINLFVVVIGGIARFKVYGEIEFDPMELRGGLVDMLSLQNGGKCLSHSNAHFGHPKNLIKPGRALNMGDGWETAVNTNFIIRNDN